MTELFDRVVNVTLKYGDQYTFSDLSQLEGVIDIPYAVLKTLEYGENIVPPTDDLSVTYNIATAVDISIETPEYGPKPDIVFEINMIPGGSCYQAKLTVRNFGLQRNVDIRKFTHMSVTVGYRVGSVRKFECPIFASYQATPNPNGETVFYGLTVGTLGAILVTKSSYRYTFYVDELTVEELMSKILTPLGYIVDPVADNDSIPSDLKSLKIQMKRETVQHETALGVINWLAQLIYTWGRAHDANLMLLVQDNHVRLVGTNVQLGMETNEDTIDLRLVKSASFTGPALTVTAPYDPKMEPGKLFLMPTYYYSGDMLPNVGLSSSEMGIIRGQERLGLFRAITVNLSFASTQNINTMTILAVPATSDQEPEADENVKIGTAQQIINDYYADQLMLDVAIGTPHKAPDAPAQDIWSMSWTNPGAVTKYEIKAGDTLSKLSEEWYGRTLFTLPKSKITLSGDWANYVFHYKGVPLYMFFPMVIKATYMQSLSASDATIYNYNNVSKSGQSCLNNPDELQPGMWLAWPSITTDVIKSQMLGKDMYYNYFLLMRDFYAERNKKAWAEYMEDIAVYIKCGSQ